MRALVFKYVFDESLKVQDKAGLTPFRLATKG